MWNEREREDKANPKIRKGETRSDYGTECWSKRAHHFYYN